MSIKTIIKFLPEVDSITEKIGEFDNLKLKLSILHEKIYGLFGEIPSDLKSMKEDIINNSNYSVLSNYKKLIYVFVINKTFEYLKSVYINENKYDAELTSSEIESFLKIIHEMVHDLVTKSLFLIFLSETCRTIDPEFSSKLMLDAFLMKPDLTKYIFETHLQNFQYNSQIINQQKKIEKCLVCGGDGVPFHNAPCYRMANYSEDFLPFKLWNKCSDCGNLFSTYFPLKFFDRKNPVKIITPNKNFDCDLKQIQSQTINSWGTILKELESYCGGKNILEIGIGNGELIATALELEYNIDCVEIEENVAKQISNLLDYPIICCDFLDLPEDKQYDIITMGDVIEHLTDPKKGLEKARRLLKDNGVLWISTPNYESAFNRLRRTSTAMWSETWHITYFYKTGLENLLREFGFKIVDYKISLHYNGSMEVIAIKN